MYNGQFTIHVLLFIVRCSWTIFHIFFLSCWVFMIRNKCYKGHLWLNDIYSVFLFGRVSKFAFLWNIKPKSMLGISDGGRTIAKTFTFNWVWITNSSTHMNAKFIRLSRLFVLGWWSFVPHFFAPPFFRFVRVRLMNYFIFLNFGWLKREFLKTIRLSWLWLRCRFNIFVSDNWNIIVHNILLFLRLKQNYVI